jgi:tetratricopeptide (TPR) repeat protein
MVMLTAAAAPAFPEPPKSRGEALAGLRSPSEATRAEAIAWIANRGGMADAPLLHERLRDDSETLREFAEGWNRRATVHYLAGEYKKSIADCDEVLKRNPQHFGALSGLGQVYFKLEDYERSLAWFRRALEVNPNMLGVEINIQGIEELLKDQRRRSI